MIFGCYLQMSNIYHIQLRGFLRDFKEIEVSLGMILFRLIILLKILFELISLMIS